MTSVFDVGVDQGHQRRRHYCDGFGVFVCWDGRSRTYCESPARLDDSSGRHVTLCLRRPEKVDLVFDGENGGIGRHQRERGVSTCRVESRRDHSGVGESMLLGEVLMMIELEADPPWAQLCDADSECAHHCLRVETRADSFCIVEVGWLEIGSHRPISSTRASRPTR